MRVAYLNADCGIPVFGAKGASVHVREMLRAFEAIGCQTRLVATRLGADPDPRWADRTIAVDVPPRGGDDRAAKEHGYLAAAEAAEDALIRLYQEWPFDLIYERYSLWSAAGVNAAARLGVPVVVEVNAPLVEEQRAHRTLVLEDVATQIEQRVFASAHGLAAVSSGVRDYALSRGAHRARTEVIGNGVDIVRFHPAVRAARLGAPGAFTVGFTGSLKAWHGVHVLAEAFRLLHREVPEAHLVIVGDGPMLGWVEGWLAGAGLVSAATLTGWRDHEDLPALLAGMDVVTAPYPPDNAFYFSPLKLYEYLAMGRPVVASRIGQIAETVEDGVSGLLVEPGDPAALAEALVRVRNENGLADRLSREAAAAGARHGWTSNARRVIEMAQRLRRAA